MTVVSDPIYPGETVEGREARWAACTAEREWRLERVRAKHELVAQLAEARAAGTRFGAAWLAAAEPLRDLLPALWEPAVIGAWRDAYRRGAEALEQARQETQIPPWEGA